MKRLLTVFVLLLAFLAVVGVATPAAETVAVIVQADSVETAVALVNEYGGQVHEQLAIINAVSAEFPVYALENISKDGRVAGIYEDVNVMASGRDDKHDSDRHDSDRDDDKPKRPNRRVPDVNFPQVMGVDAAWEAGYTGEGVTVALVDSGINRMSWNRGRIVARYDALDNGTRWRDPYGHGTMMAGLIANNKQDSNGYVGIAPEVDLVDVRALDKEGKGTYSDIIEALDWILANHEEYDIDVVNLSIVSGITSPYWADPLDMAVEALWDEGIVVVAAAGNLGPDPLTIAAPGNDPYVITVGAFTDNFTPADESDDYVTPFSSAGPTETGFVKPDVIAPGAHMLTEVSPVTYWAREHKDNRVKGHFYETAGTSSATAVTTGVVALMLDANPDMTPNEVKYALMNSARPAVYEDGTLAWSIFQQGAGRVWAETAVLNPPQGEANTGMVIGEPYVGPVVYRDDQFIIVDENGDPL
ncbi:MAG: hypothetical protein D6835_02740, partial [Candidatus Thermofonsia bacterium]